MITQKEDDSFDVSCNSSLVEGSRRGGMKEKQAVKKREATTFLQVRDDPFFSIFSKIFPFNFKDRRNSTRFSSVSFESLRYEKKRKKKRKERENKRGRRIEEEMEGSEGERRRKQRGGEERVAHNGANEKEEGGKGEEAKEK